MGEYEPDDRRNMDRRPNTAGNAPEVGWHEREDAQRQPPARVIREEVAAEPGAPQARSVRGEPVARPASEQGRAPASAPDPAQNDFVRKSPQATTQAERTSPARAAPTGTPGERAEVMREQQRQDGHRPETSEAPDASRRG